MTTKKILFLVPYPLHVAPSQRFRVELYLPLLEKKNIEYKISPFLDEETYKVLYNQASLWKKLSGVFKGFLRRWRTVIFEVRNYDYVFVHREASPLGPPVFEWMIARLWRKKMIYDFDDAIWIPDSKNKLLNWFKAYWKTGLICSWAYKVAGGNEYLCEFARKYNNKVVRLPTCVDTELYHNQLKEQSGVNLVVGWTGSHSTLRFLDPLVPLLQKLVEEYKIEVLVICNKAPSFSFPGLIYQPWKEETEISDLLRINIGIMPLENDAWSEGKCGFKLVQYLALGIPAAASPVGVNRDIIEPGINGFLCSSEEDWRSALELLISNSDLRNKMGKTGREKIVAHYSIQANAGVFFGLFNRETAELDSTVA